MQPDKTESNPSQHNFTIFFNVYCFLLQFHASFSFISRIKSVKPKPGQRRSERSADTLSGSLHGKWGPWQEQGRQNFMGFSMAQTPL